MKFLNVRNVSMKKAVFLALLAALTLSAASPAVAAGDSVVVRVPAQVRAQVDAARVQPVQVLDYGSFYWMEVKAADLDRLAGVPYVVVPDARQVRVPGFRFDPLADGEPVIPADRRADASRPGFRLVQLIGPPQDAWLSRLDATGARVLQYYPHNTYLVWGRPAASEAVGSSRLRALAGRLPSGLQGQLGPAGADGQDRQRRRDVLSRRRLEGDPRSPRPARGRGPAGQSLPAGQGFLRRHRPHRRRGAARRGRAGRRSVDGVREPAAGPGRRDVGPDRGRQPSRRQPGHRLPEPPRHPRRTTAPASPGRSWTRAWTTTTPISPATSWAASASRGSRPAATRAPSPAPTVTDGGHGTHVAGISAATPRPASPTPTASSMAWAWPRSTASSP